MSALTGSKEIPCVDCDKEKRNIELGGTFEVTSCKPIDGQDNVPPAERICKIEFRLKGSAPADDD